MSATLKDDLADQAQKFWSPNFTDELKETSVLPNLLSREYEGEIKRGGDTVYVSQINRPLAERKNIAAGDNSFNSQKMTTSRIAITANQRITASFELEDLIGLQTQIEIENNGGPDSEIKKKLLEAAEIELNNYLYTMVAPSTSSPDHVITSVTDFSFAQLKGISTLASQAKWAGRGSEWYGLLDPMYYHDFLDEDQTSNADYAPDKPLVAGRVGSNRMGFQIFEDNSEGILSLSGSSADAGLFFHKDFMHLVMQRQPTFKISDLHSNKQHGFLISVDMVIGSALGIDGNLKHISVIDS